ncbi:MAG: alpha/beta hydrolase [Desulfomonile sp.]|nr:alpha/beta hydrolase [Desulfomonile sp.]
MGLASDALDRLIESQIFFPDPNLGYSPADFGLEFEDVWLETTDRVRLHGWHFPAGKTRPLLLFCHGNAGNISHRLDNIQRLLEKGIGVFIFDYRGYGRSEGRITERGFYLDADAAYEYARARASADRIKLVIFGRSLGGIAAVYLASKGTCDGVILESTFTNVKAMAREHFLFPVPGIGLEKRLDALGRIRKVKAPILFFHGDRDDIVPIRIGRELFDAAPPAKEFVTLVGAGHNDTYLLGGEAYFDRFARFIEELPSPAGP